MSHQQADTAEFDRVQDLIYELRIEQVMTRNVLTIKPDAYMREARKIMRERRISGLPVVNEEDKLVGIISIEDVINWLATSGDATTEVRQKMSPEVVTARAEERVAEAMKKFARYGYGRLPVTDGDGKVVGIVSPGDITGRLLANLSQQYREEDATRRDPTRVIDLLAADETVLSLRFNVAPGDFHKAGEASIGIKRALLGLGIDHELVRRVAVCAYEAEMNIVIHSFGGILLAEVRPDRVTIAATDAGPGIADTVKAVEPGYSTAPDWIRELGFGAGMGLTNIQKHADQFELESEVGKGTTVTAVIYVRERNEASPDR